MTCPQIRPHLVPIHPHHQASERPQRRPSARSARQSSLQGGNPSDRLQGLCGASRVPTRGSLSVSQIPGLLARAERLAEGGSSELNRGVEAYNAAVVAWRTYEAGRPAGSPPSRIAQLPAWSEARSRLVAAAERQGYRLRGLEQLPSEQLVFRIAESPAPTERMTETQVSAAVLRLTRIRNRVRALDAIEDDMSRPMNERLRAAASAVALVRQAAALVERLRSQAPNPRDARIQRLSGEILHAACDDPNTAAVAAHTDPEWVANTVRLYHGTAQVAVSAAFDRRGETGDSNRVLLARLHLLRARRASFALGLSNDPAHGAQLSAQLQGERVGLHRRLMSTQRRIVRDQVREANRLLTRAHSVLGRSRSGLSEERREAAMADYRRGQGILLYLSELSSGDARVSRLRHDRRWARIDAAMGRASA